MLCVRQVQGVDAVGETGPGCRRDRARVWTLYVRQDRGWLFVLGQYICNTETAVKVSLC